MLAAVAAEVTVALVIGEDDDEVGLVGSFLSGRLGAQGEG